ncbi:Uncharacterized protein Rs2_00376 [Raphanus sativus]|nr:Uncharacterized protein Rs2_00376 [Raphanus sativus]
MLHLKKKHRPPFALSFKARHLMRSLKRSDMAKKKIKSISLAVISDSGVAASGFDMSSLVSLSAGSPPVKFGSLPPVNHSLSEMAFKSAFSSPGSSDEIGVVPFEGPPDKSTNIFFSGLGGSSSQRGFSGRSTRRYT